LGNVDFFLLLNCYWNLDRVDNRGGDTWEEFRDYFAWQYDFFGYRRGHWNRNSGNIYKVVGRDPAQEVPAGEGQVEGSLVEGSLVEEGLMKGSFEEGVLVDKIQAQLAEEERAVVGIWSGRGCRQSRRQLHLA